MSANLRGSGEAPGRVNLLGEHTDYNDGFVLPAAIPQRTRVQAEGAGGFLLQALGRGMPFRLDAAPAEQPAKYVYGCIKELEALGIAVPPMRFQVDSDVPIGVGLSSSAALEVATLRALRAALGLSLDDVAIARLAQRAEVRHAGVRCGIMDQMAASLAQPGTMLFLDTRSLERRLLPLPEGAALAVVDSGVERSLAASGYNERRAQCEAAARELGVPALRDVASPRALERLPEPLRRRARHVVSENCRVLSALGADAATFGRLMDASHASLRDDFEVSTRELDTLVECLRAQPDVLGARLTGAGFGGACVALCRAGTARAAAEAALARYGGAGRVLVA
ncbi:MAG TPA: galactokinase family protein [Burkholderiales bacterium]|nr:galactokinase family protein [Burkholderiales bacterium]